MILKHEFSSLIIPVAKDTVLSTFAAFVKMRRSYKRIWDELVRFESGDSDEYDLTDSIEANFVSDIEVLVNMAYARMCVFDPLNTYFDRIMHTVAVTNENLSVVRDGGYAPNDEELSKLKDGVYQSLAGVLYMLQWEFRCGQTCLSAEENFAANVEIDEIVYTYFSSQAKDTGETVSLSLAFAKDVLEDCAKFRMRMDLFDEMPEKEAPFESIAGPALGGINPEKLTAEMVDAVIAGEMDIDELIAKAGYGSDDLDDLQSEARIIAAF